MSTVRVTMSTNSAASALDGEAAFAGVPAKCRHNGGKLVIITVDGSRVAALKAALDAAHSVRSYEVVP